MSKQYDFFWKFHNKDNMDIHAVKLIKWQAEQIKSLEAGQLDFAKEMSRIHKDKIKRIKELEDCLISIRKSTEIMEARRFAEQALKG